MGDMAGACKDWRKASELGYDNVNRLIRENCN